MLSNKGERFKLWISFAESFNEMDEEGRAVGYANARAAMGGLAMMADIPQLSITMCEHGKDSFKIYFCFLFLFFFLSFFFVSFFFSFCF